MRDKKKVKIEYIQSLICSFQYENKMKKIIELQKSVHLPDCSKLFGISYGGIYSAWTLK